MVTPLPVYDSAQPRRPIVSEFQALWTHRGLIRLLVTRDLTVRYKRSVLGAWWTLINPLLTVLVFWIVFSNLFGRTAGEVPYVVYVSTGILFASFFTQGVIDSGGAIVSSRAILEKVHVPPEVFSVSAAMAAAANFLISMVALLAILALTATPPSWMIVLTPVSIVAMLMMVAGAGLIVASGAVLFYDVFALVRVLTLLLMYTAATFYPLSIVPERWQFVLFLNPLFHHLRMFRTFVYGEPLSTLSLAVTLGSGVVTLAVGVWVFSRSWKSVVMAL